MGMLKSQLNNRILTLKKEKGIKDQGNVQTKGYMIRLNRDLGELDLEGTTAKLEIENKETLTPFFLTLKPIEGLYKGAEYRFKIDVPTEWPHQPPRATYVSERKLWHPNIDEEGHVCLNILRKDYRPVVTMKMILYGLELLFIEPNPDDPLNRDAAKQFREDPRGFEQKVKRWMAGNYW
eukprot:NODE_1231_length_577_cov_68.655303_g1157_i0.p1 GENE.NODE_1231_length_577_cov_68.655303_g1157_i0~~NODE_1231_length_577_cov_68.655303_g1157_i0.p1  ORF type:complete len:189 (+),score=51.78 NODE_1231_length_577_cov_68.655303_g1157_i0:32-568(+)